MKQCVYFFSQKGTNFVKIGMTASSDITDRYRSFCVYAPMGAEIFGIIKTNNARELELKIHKELAHRRLNGEFFNISKTECENIIERFNSQEVNSIVSKFYIWLSKNESNIEDFHLERKNTVKKITSEREIYDEIVQFYIDSENRDTFMTSTDILKKVRHISGNKLDSTRSFGMALKRHLGKSKSVQKNGKVSQMYYLGFKNID